eukprot:3034168-Rhodomonas_salina.1
MEQLVYFNFRFVNGQGGMFAVAPTAVSSGRDAVGLQHNNASLLLSLAPGQNGIATYALLANDLGFEGTSNETNLLIEVLPVNSRPRFKLNTTVVTVFQGEFTTVNYNRPMFAYEILQGLFDGDEADQNLTFSVATSNSSFFQIPPLIQPDGTLVFRVANFTIGQVICSVVLKDDGGVANGGNGTSTVQTFQIFIGPVNSAPVFTIVRNPTPICPNSTSIQAFSSVFPAPAGSLADLEASQSMTFLFDINSVDPPDLFLSDPLLSSSNPSSGFIEYQVREARAGIANVTLRLTDDGGTEKGGVNTSASQTLILQVVERHLAPTFTLTQNPLTVLERVAADDTARNIPDFVVDISKGFGYEASQDLTFFVVPSSARVPLRPGN